MGGVLGVGLRKRSGLISVKPSGWFAGDHDMTLFRRASSINKDRTMSTHLTAGQKALLEAELQAHRRALLTRQDLHHAGRSRVDHARDVLQQDGDDAPQRDADREVDLALTDQTVADLQAVDAALQRLADGRYGLCEDCTAVIPYDRLRHTPQVARCVSCQQTVEGKGRTG